MSKPNLEKIPVNACNLRAEFAHIGNNGDGAKTAPVKLLARSSKAIEHWYWGNVVHDVSGYNLNGKSRLPIDFDHDTGEAIGYINKFESDADGLWLSGTIVSTEDGDRAGKIISQMQAGIPYEASINFGGDGIEVEEVPSGKTTSVNGYELAGESLVVRKWPLRGVAVTLYGADSSTSTTLLSGEGTVSASIITNKQEAGDMSKPEELSVEAVAAVETPSEAAEVAPTNELSQAVEAEAAEPAEGVEVAEVEAQETETDHQFSASEFARLVTDFGAEVAAQTVTNGGGYNDALQLAYEQRGERIAELEGKVSEFTANPRTASTAVAFADGETAKTKKPKRLRDASLVFTQ